MVVTAALATAVATQFLSVTMASASTVSPPQVNMNYYQGGASQTVSTDDLPICPPPSDTPVSPNLPLADPNAPHCYVSPEVGGLVVNGARLQSTAPLVVGPNNPGYQTGTPVSPTATPVAGGAFGSPTPPLAGLTTGSVATPQVTIYDEYQNGPQNGVGYYGIFSAEESEAPTFSGSGDISNWVGVQNAPGSPAPTLFWQFGMIDTNYSQACGNISTPLNTEVLFSEAMVAAGDYWPIYCWSNYTFPYGTYQEFVIEWQGPPNSTYSGDQWDQWLDYNGTWELLDAFGQTPTMTPYSDYFEIVSESQTLSASAQPATIPATGDGSNQLEGYEQWTLWNQAEATNWAREGPYCWTPSTNSPSGNYSTLIFYNSDCSS
jgi:hypothetical protein